MEEVLFRVIGGNEYSYRSQSCDEEAKSIDMNMNTEAEANTNEYKKKAKIRASEGSLPAMDYFSPGAKYTLISGANGLDMAEDTTPLLYKQIVEHEDQLAAAVGAKKNEGRSKYKEKSEGNSNRYVDGPHQYHFHVEPAFSYGKVVDTVLNAMMAYNDNNSDYDHTKYSDSDRDFDDNKPSSNNKRKGGNRKRKHYHILSNTPNHHLHKQRQQKQQRVHSIIPTEIPLNLEQIEEVLSITSPSLSLSSLKINNVFNPSLHEEDRLFLHEIQALFYLPSLLQQHHEKEEEQQQPQDSHMIFVNSNSLLELKKKHGEYSEQVALATKLMDVAFTYLYLDLINLSNHNFLSSFISTLPLSSSPSSIASIAVEENKNENQNKKNRKLSTSTIRAPDYGYQYNYEMDADIQKEYEYEFNNPRRRLAYQNTTISEIENVNMITWTTVILILMGWAAVMILAGAADGPRDPLLYAKFQADTGDR